MPFETLAQTFVPDKTVIVAQLGDRYRHRSGLAQGIGTQIHRALNVLDPISYADEMQACHRLIDPNKRLIEADFLLEPGLIVVSVTPGIAEINIGAVCAALREKLGLTGLFIKMDDVPSANLVLSSASSQPVAR